MTIDFWINVFKAALAFTLLVWFHELGHFIACKLVGVRVEVFSIGFVPIIKKKIGETEYAIGAIPLGGYIKPAGGDLSADAESTGAPDEFLSKNFWQKSFILLAGPLMNVVLAIFVFWVVAFFIGVSEFHPDNRIGQLEKDYPALAAGLAEGDRILEINQVKTSSWEEVTKNIKKSNGKPLVFKIQRDSKEFDLTITPKKDPQYGTYRIGIKLFFDPVIGKLDKNSPAYKAGLRRFDKIIEVNGRPIKSFPMIAPSEKPLNLKIQRESKELSFKIIPEKEGGFNYSGEYEKQLSYGLTIYFPRKKFTFVNSIKYSLKMTGVSCLLIIQALKMIAQKISMAKQLGGPILISYILYETSKSGLADLLSMIALLSVNLAFINLFPLIIITDGGQISIFAIEALRKKRFSAKSRAILNTIGFFLVISLAVFIIVNDIIRFL
ncbi:RIP metalloprotease RseP [Candidatus Dependentiae bacterium]|nr:RIP metalloprotease RseP [Candidatus Dependentiae bacterium]